MKKSDFTATLPTPVSSPGSKLNPHPPSLGKRRGCRLARRLFGGGMSPASKAVSLWILAFLIASASSYSQSQLSTVAATPNSVTIDYRPSFYRPEKITIGGVGRLYFKESEMIAGRGANQASLPHESVLIGIPPTGGVRIEILNEQTDKGISAALAPVPTVSFSDDSLHRVIRTFSPGDPPGNVSEPAVRIDTVFWWRYQRIARLLVNPYSYDAGSHALKKRDEIRFRVQFSQPIASAMDPDHSAMGQDNSAMEPLYRSLLANYDQAKQWRSVPLSISTTQSDSSFWFDPAASYIRIPIARDGIYRIAYADLQSRGLLPGIPDFHKLDLFYKGISLPVRTIGEADGVFGAGDAIEFYGSKLYDSSGVEDQYSDTSVYWLTFGGTGSKRTEIDSTINGSPDVIAASFPATYRMEQDSFYYYGNGGLPTNNQTQQVPGEGWYWRQLLANQTTSVNFTSYHFYKTGNPNYTVRGRILSPVVNQVAPNHSIEVLVNGTPIGTVDLQGYSDTLFAFTAPSSLFVEGSNSISFHSNPTAASINEVYLDYVEVECSKMLTADGDTLAFSAGTTPT